MSTNTAGLPEHLRHKSRLHEFTQRSSLPLPVYKAVNEGQPHTPKFRATVDVDGASYTSSNTFTTRKAAEQDVARLALESLEKKIKDEASTTMNYEDTKFCKSILNEFVDKMKMEKPTYHTVQPDIRLPVFKCTLVFNGVTYSAESGRTKKEAEHLAARAVILSLLGESPYGKSLTMVIKSKGKLFAALNKAKGSVDAHTGSQPLELNMSISQGQEVIATVVTDDLVNAHTGCQPLGVNMSLNQGQEVRATVVTDDEPRRATTPEPRLVNQPPYYEFKSPKEREDLGSVELPNTFVPAAAAQLLGAAENSSKRRRKNKKKANKRSCIDTRLTLSMVAVDQASQAPQAPQAPFCHGVC